MPDRKFIAVTDTHGELQDDNACQVLWDWMDWFAPDDRFHLGDVWDFPWLRKNAGREDLERDPKLDMEKGSEFLHKYNPTHLCWGNHDMRLFNAMNSSVGSTKRFAEWIYSQIEDLTNVRRCRYHLKDGWFEYGDHVFMHGYRDGKTATRLQGAYAHKHLVHGHNHRVETTAIPRLSGRLVARCIGCLCKLGLDYAYKNEGTLTEEHGFLYGWKKEDGTLITFQAQNLNGEWHFPSDIISYEHVQPR